MIMEMIEKLWEATCSGDINTLSNYYENKRDAIPVRYKKFGSEHSLIMGFLDIINGKQLII